MMTLPEWSALPERERDAICASLIGLTPPDDADSRWWTLKDEKQIELPSFVADYNDCRLLLDEIERRGGCVAARFNDLVDKGRYEPLAMLRISSSAIAYCCVVACEEGT